MTIAAVIVTFNRKELLRECINSLFCQSRPLDSIIIVNNASTDGTESMLKEDFLRNEIIDYVRLSENLGGAGGFREGIKRAFEKGFDWIWIMDDDAEPKKNALEILVKSEIFNQDTSALASLKYDLTGRRLDRHTGFFSYSFFASSRNGLSDEILRKKYVNIEIASFVGILINRLAVRQIGLPASQLFIQYDDTEYCFRLRKFGQIYLIPKSIVIHKEKSNSVPRNFFGWMFRRSKLGDIWKEYYGFRNIFFLFNMGHIPRWHYLTLGFYLAKTTLAILLLDNKPCFRLKYYYLGLLDGIRGRFGKVIDPKEFFARYKNYLKKNQD